MANSEHADQDHRELSWRLGQSYLGACHNCIHLCCGWHATVWQELPGQLLQDLSGQSATCLWKRHVPASTLAHAWLPAFFPRRVPSFVWRVDWDHVGLYGSAWKSDHVYHCLHDGHGHWKLGGTLVSVGNCLIHIYLIVMCCIWVKTLSVVVFFFFNSGPQPLPCLTAQLLQFWEPETARWWKRWE